MTHLSYHQNVFDLLDIELGLSGEALRMIEECERRCGASLPRALRDWYATEQVVPLRRATSEVAESNECPLWHDYSNMDGPLPLEVVLASFEQLNGDEAPTGKRFLEILIENQGVWVCSA